jgi:cell division protein FtsI (penicillin-binding protein 3)
MGLPASGGLMSGGIFHNISEGVMAKKLKLRVEDARDSLSVLIPEVKAGDNAATSFVLGKLGINASKVSLPERKSTPNKMPDMKGLGARDAVYQLERIGVKVKLRGTGMVRRQDIAPGTILKPGMLCTLELN